MQIKQTEAYRKWEQGLKDERATAAIAARFFRLENGLAGDVVSVGDGVSEMRIHYGPGYRIYFQRRGQDIVILLCRGNKSTQKRDIQAAKLLARMEQ